MLLGYLRDITLPTVQVDLCTGRNALLVRNPNDCRALDGLVRHVNAQVGRLGRV